MIIPKELKEAISNLTSTEKDKLIFRLLKKDLVLANRLLFELVEQGSVEDEREKIKAFIENRTPQLGAYWYTPGTLMMDIRGLTGYINEHVVITKDKYGEASLNLFLVNLSLEIHRDKILSTNFYRSEKLCVYIIGKIFKILIGISKLHEDFFIDFRDDLDKLGNLIENNAHLKNTAQQNGLDINWLIDGSIPENIIDIHKQIRERGLLR